ncbi:MAG: response regulator [Elusimicrobia bacterium]|nr:response regulator [Elusimicrobiota bacterium]
MAAQIIIVDDDPLVGGLTLDLLTDAGYSVRLLSVSLTAMDIIKAEKPALVILDILMPGLDGLTLLHKLKSDPETEPIRVVVVSGKSFEAEKQRAAQYGAEDFIEKPYDVDQFPRRIGELMKKQGAEPRKAPSAAEAPAPAARAGIKAVVWGCRSSSSAGKRTSCVSIETPSHLFVFDAGSGISSLGDELAKSGKHKDIWLFLTHFHDDHVEGLASFPCARDKDCTLHVSGASDPDKPLEQALKAAFGHSTPAAKVELYELMEQTYEILPGVRLAVFYANHPGTTLAYVLQTDGRKIVYCPDSELYGEHATALQDYDEKIGEICRGADLMFHDGRYTAEDYKKHRNSGHSSFLAAVDFAGKNLVKALVLVHQDAVYSDGELSAMEKEARARANERGYALKVALGREGLEVAA